MSTWAHTGTYAYSLQQFYNTKIQQTWIYTPRHKVQHLFHCSTNCISQFRNLTYQYAIQMTDWRVSHKTWLVKGHYGCHCLVPSLIMSLLLRTGTHWMLLEVFEDNVGQKQVLPILNLRSPSRNLYSCCFTTQESMSSASAYAGCQPLGPLMDNTVTRSHDSIYKILTQLICSTKISSNA